mmetsp:Transcript_27336/g.58058  ORF Transcript_27336/g.58058 Transcript_27336/m.58058 type:complete len:209 (-) Transcript_27336:346-972(-)
MCQPERSASSLVFPPPTAHDRFCGCHGQGCYSGHSSNSSIQATTAAATTTTTTVAAAATVGSCAKSPCPWQPQLLGWLSASLFPKGLYAIQLCSAKETCFAMPTSCCNAASSAAATTVGRRLHSSLVGVSSPTRRAAATATTTTTTTVTPANAASAATSSSTTAAAAFQLGPSTLDTQTPSLIVTHVATPASLVLQVWGCRRAPRPQP